MNCFSFLRLVALAGCLSTANAETDTNLAPAAVSLRDVKPTELAAEVLAVIRKAKTSERARVTELSIALAVKLRPAIAVVLVGTVAADMPEVAAIAAGTAAARLPELATRIGRTATRAAPTEAPGIAAALCRAVPGCYRDIIRAVCAAAPAATRDVLKALGSTFPDFKPAIDAALAQYKNRDLPLEVVLEKLPAAMDPPVANGPQPLGPYIGPPFIPLAGSVKTLTPDTSDEVPTGGRDYARP